MKDTLYNFHSNVLIVGLLTFGFMATIVADRAFCVMTLVPLSAFITQVMLMIYFSQIGRTDYSEKTLFITILLYMTFLGAFFMLISDYYAGDTFLFSKVDAMFYYRESTKAANAGFSKGFDYLMSNYDSEDWGALMFDMIVMSIFPNKFFLNAIYTLLSSLSSLNLFRIGKFFMPESYAFLAALGFSSSSFVIFYNCSFLKESIFLFIITSLFYYLYQTVVFHSYTSIFPFVLFVLAVLFFRPAVIAFVAASVFVYYGITQRGKAISLFFYVGALACIAISLTVMQDLFNNYTSGGNLDNVSDSISNSAYSSSFNFYVSYFGAFFGPFPSLFAKITGPSTLEYLGAGLMYKLFIALSFWYGVFIVFKKGVVELIPLVLFVIIELLLTGAILASLELRKVIVHIPFMYVLSFYGMYKGFVPNQITRFTMLPTYLFAVGVLLLWNVMKIKA